MNPSHSEPDALKALLMDAAPPAPPAHDLAFALDVMKRIEKRRLIEGLLTLASGMVTLCALLYVVMPYLSPALIGLGSALAPALAVLITLGALLTIPPFRRYLPI
ncbi:hypothetical protein [Asticcacaulis sp. EMRT-3]|uniref:hypothetical protein n=1 Tax=Asticcacaulis sp. EMRT-3 TaxID=3040349 RepID=UPI0024AE8E56|nr:hypothetical protein [Asticcacaulis sp. EMRT-3]MDI7774422.1 hypothetical protein [Asticcacaulis sp. EMRT-3]